MDSLPTASTPRDADDAEAGSQGIIGAFSFLCFPVILPENLGKVQHSFFSAKTLVRINCEKAGIL